MMTKNDEEEEEKTDPIMEIYNSLKNNLNKNLSDYNNLKDRVALNTLNKKLQQIISNLENIKNKLQNSIKSNSNYKSLLGPTLDLAIIVRNIINTDTYFVNLIYNNSKFIPMGGEFIYDRELNLKKIINLIELNKENKININNDIFLEIKDEVKNYEDEVKKYKEVK